MPKAIRGLDPADNGNEFLCLSCTYSASRAGTMSQMEVSCGSSMFNECGPRGSNLVAFRITRCSEYRHKEVSKEYDDMPGDARRTALYLDRRATVHGDKNKHYMKFVDYNTAVATQLIYE